MTMPKRNVPSRRYVRKTGIWTTTKIQLYEFYEYRAARLLPSLTTDFIGENNWEINQRDRTKYEYTGSSLNDCSQFESQLGVTDQLLRLELSTICYIATVVKSIVIKNTCLHPDDLHDLLRHTPSLEHLRLEKVITVGDAEFRPVQLHKLTSYRHRTWDFQWREDASFPFYRNGGIHNFTNSLAKVEIESLGGSGGFKFYPRKEALVFLPSLQLNHDILVNLTHSFSLKTLVIQCCHKKVNVVLIPKTLEHLELQKVFFTNGTIGNLFSTLINLKTLHIESEDSVELSDFPRGLKTLATGLKTKLIGNIYSSSNGTQRFQRLERMYMDHYSRVDIRIMGQFRNIFPNLKTYMGPIHHLKYIMTLDSIQYIFTYGGTTRDRTPEKCNVENCVWSKNSTSGEWQSVQINATYFQEQKHKLFPVFLNIV